MRVGPLRYEIWLTSFHVNADLPHPLTVSKNYSSYFDNRPEELHTRFLRRYRYKYAPKKDPTPDKSGSFLYNV
jgi:hypothetical protein